MGSGLLPVPLGAARPGGVVPLRDVHARGQPLQGPHCHCPHLRSVRAPPPHQPSVTADASSDRSERVPGRAGVLVEPGLVRAGVPSTHIERPDADTDNGLLSWSERNRLEALMAYGESGGGVEHMLWSWAVLRRRDGRSETTREDVTLTVTELATEAEVEMKLEELDDAQAERIAAGVVQPEPATALPPRAEGPGRPVGVRLPPGAAAGDLLRLTVPSGSPMQASTMHSLG